MCEQPSEPPSKHKQNPIKDSNSNPYNTFIGSVY